ncbi:DUF4982 domain-containing protein [Termitidicoccus mucosus]|uniref:glycoside hydrolase family 2 TIM barrel-domain containing protein n=1 Tax=Termitidicoccus mucosus TaxID=1184151 RepID=UPI000A01FDF1
MKTGFQTGCAGQRDRLPSGLSPIISALAALILILGLPCALAFAQVSFGQPEKINTGWRFARGEVKDAQAASLDDSGWRRVDLPHDWSVEAPLSPSLASCTGYLPGGIGWYRKTIAIPEALRGRKIYLYFEGVYNRSEVFLNGHSLGRRPNGYISFMYDATPHARFGAENVIAVKVDHGLSADSRWYTGSGIYRNVWLVHSSPVHIAQWGVYAHPELDGATGTLNIEVEVTNDSRENAGLNIAHELLAPDGKVVAASSQPLSVESGKNGKSICALKVDHPLLWDMGNPVLYKLRTVVSRGAEVLDSAVTTTGFRSLSFDPDKGMALNGKWIKVKGVCLHHDAGVLGAAVPRDVWKRRLVTLKSLGCNAIRTSHNPQAPDLYELCDELGLLVLNEAFDEWEFPKRKWLQGWNVGQPGYQGSSDFFDEWAERDLADMIRRDRNHPSIFAWSIGNEVDYPNDPYSHPVLGGKNTGGFVQPIFGGYKKDAPDARRLGEIAKRFVAVVKKHDTSRPVTAGLAGVAMSNETEYPGALDITGYNYTESRYISDHKAYPARVIFGSENGHQRSAWQAVAENEHIFGQFLWTGIDYLGESRKWPSRGFHSGLLDFAGFIKPLGYFRRSLWTDQPMAYIGAYPVPTKEEKSPSMDAWPIWNHDEGRPIRVVCYTNAARARLELNGQPAGDPKDYDDKTGIIYWDIPFQAGKLEVVALDRGNNEILRHAIRTSGRPHALAIQNIEKSIGAEGGLAQIVVQAVDDEGVPVLLADDEVTCHITGPARLLGLESGNNEDMTDYTDNKHRLHHGRILAYVQARGEPGDMEVRFTAPWLKPARAVIHIE